MTPSGTHLLGLEGTNPLGFLAALGVQILFEWEPMQPNLWWSNGVVPHAVVDDEFTVARIVEQAVQQREEWLACAVFTFRDEGEPIKDVKLSPHALRELLEVSAGDPRAARLAAALVSEGSTGQNSNEAKPTDFHFTAGQQGFLKLAREILQRVTGADIETCLNDPKRYGNSPTLMWDVRDDRVYALAATDPAKGGKLTSPGAEYLALLGLCRFPVFTGDGRTLTTACSESWSQGRFTWPLWDAPAGAGAVRSLLAHPSLDASGSPYPGRRLISVWASAIDRTRKGKGYGAFSPPVALWVSQFR